MKEKASLIQDYEARVQQLELDYAALKKNDNRYALVRFLIIASGLALLIGGVSQESNPILFLITFPLIIFFIVMKKHGQIQREINIVQQLLKINRNEIGALRREKADRANGSNFIDPKHPYSFDLDFFGENSLYQYLNRTATYLGSVNLAKSLLAILPKEKIEENQLSIRELTTDIDLRQRVEAIASVNRDSSETYQSIKDWLTRKGTKLSPLTNVLSFLFPSVTIVFSVLYFAIPFEAAGRLALLSILANLTFVAIFSKKILQEFIPSAQISRILEQYAILFDILAKSEFKSDGLKQLQQRLLKKGNKPGQLVSQLSSLFLKLQHVKNPYASPILNGLFLFHLHILGRIYRWRNSYGDDIMRWLESLGEFEKLSSFANFSYNNPSFTFPEIKDDFSISFESMRHPLLDQSKAVGNSIDFYQFPFFILTGSNMSGKSTFLRAIGVNMVLGSVGAPVAATKASIHPLPILVSMRLSDSLADSESYFFAEVKRLKFIMDLLDEQPCFVLLDEILRGTNSDDKRTGTLGVLHQLMKRKVFGGIATHDLEVCKITQEFPDLLTNKRFEVEINDHELSFDYKLRDGICENKSASYIMQKMQII
ncbi:MAG: DNA mismatch repair protein [Bacteroidota bacterium]